MEQTLAARAAPRASPEQGLIWTDYGFLAALAIALAVAVDPLNWDLAQNVLFKHLALLVVAPVTALALLLRSVELSRAPGRIGAAPPARPVLGALGTAWPLALFGLMAAAGGAYARLAQGSVSTFFVYGLYVLMMFLAAAMVVQCRSPLALLRAYFALLLGAALVMSALLVRFAGDRQVYHEQIFLVIPMAALAFGARAPALLRWTGAAFFLSMAWFSHKWTSYLVGALAAFYLLAFLWVPRLRARDALARLAAAYWGALGLATTGAAAIAWALRRGSANDPTGNLDYRLRAYQEAWQHFLDSPLWGSWFTREAAEKFTLFDIGVAGNVLPTHSDVLDVLANGGLLAALLCALGLAAIARLAWRRLLRPGAIERPEAPCAHALALMSLSAIVVCAFNPILLEPSMAALAWAHLGMLLGLALRAEGPPPAR